MGFFKSFFRSKGFFLPKEEPSPLLTDTQGIVCVLCKGSQGYFLRVVELEFRALVPLGEHVVRLPEGIEVLDAQGSPKLATWQFWVVVDSDRGCYTLVDLRPDQAAYVEPPL